MKVIALIALSILFMSAGWRTDFSTVKGEAKQNHKLILLKFSGSDWCLPCIRMEKEVFANDSFANFAEGHLLMVNADFPRLSKHKLGKELVAQNDALAEKYDKEGHFPRTVLIDGDGKVLKVWDGYTGAQPDEYIRQIKTIGDAL